MKNERLARLEKQLKECNPSTLHLGDTVVCQKNYTVYDGEIMAISYRGITVCTSAGTEFVKWSNVIEKTNK